MDEGPSGSSRIETPSSWCSVSIWYQERHIVIALDPGTLLGDLLDKVLSEHGLPKPIINGSIYESSLVPYDASGCGEEKVLTPAQKLYTLERLGWFPAGVLVLREGNDMSAKSFYGKTERVKPSSVFDAVARRHNHWDSLDAGGEHRVRVAKSAVQEHSHKAAFSKIDIARQAATSKAAMTVWHMLAKRHAIGNSSIRPEDRFHLILHRETSFSIYCFFARAQAIAKAVDFLVQFVTDDPENHSGIRRVICIHKKQLPLAASFDDLQRRGLINDFDLVELLDAHNTAEVSDEPHSTPPPQPSLLAAAPAPSSGPSSEITLPTLPISIKFENRTITLPELDPDVSTVADLRQTIATITHIPLEEQKLLCKGADKLNNQLDILLKDTALTPNSTIIILRAQKAKNKKRQLQQRRSPY